MAPRAHIAHSTRGRVRLKIPDAKKKPSQLERIRNSLESMEGVESAEANTLTGSILLLHDPALDGTFRELLRTFASEAGLFSLQEFEPPWMDILTADVEKEAEFLATRSKTAARIVHQTRKANLIVKKASDNMVDLNTLVPLSFATFSIAAMRNARRGTPFWITLGLFAFNSFLSLQSGQSKGARQVR